MTRFAAAPLWGLAGAPPPSRIGIGCYRMGRRDPEHAAALTKALSLGCTLIDTASSYMNGESEALVGEVLAATGSAARVMTKAGYVTPTEADFFSSAAGSHAARDLVFEAGRSPHCIHPDFLRVQIARSMARLGRSSIDGFLLHNPENLFSEGVEPDAVLAKIAQAFAFLEDFAEQGVIGAYGVSSNRLTAMQAPPGALALDALTGIAKSVSAENRFRLIQFPANLIERQGFEPTQGQSLVAAVRSSELVSIANRPLNAMAEGIPVRLATSHDQPDVRDKTGSSSQAFERLVALINTRLDALNTEPEAEALPLLRAIRARLDAPEPGHDVRDLFEHPVRLFMDQIYSGDTPIAVSAAMTEIRDCLIAREDAAARARTLAARDRFVSEGRIAPDDPRDIQHLACSALFEAGFDHVLVGMRRRAYVDSFAPWIVNGC